MHMANGQMPEATNKQVHPPSPAQHPYTPILSGMCNPSLTSGEERGVSVGAKGNQRHSGEDEGSSHLGLAPCLVEVTALRVGPWGGSKLADKRKPR